MSFISRVITVSEDNRAHLMRNHHVPERKIRVVLNGIPSVDGIAGSDLRGELGIGSDALLIAVVGALEERKGHPTLFEALARMPDTVHALVVGEGRMERDLRDKSAALDLSGRVHFTGQRDDVASILRSVDMLVVPSIIEATPYVILEAMEAGLPVVASSVFGIPEMVEDGDTGLLVPPDDVEALERAIESLQADPDRRRAMGKNALERFSARFTLDRCVRETIEIYREMSRG
jgi:glycosyltransferase involved in cell wall biosynthesis